MDWFIMFKWKPLQVRVCRVSWKKVRINAIGFLLPSPVELRGGAGDGILPRGLSLHACSVVPREMGKCESLPTRLWGSPCTTWDPEASCKISSSGSPSHPRSSLTSVRMTWHISECTSCFSAALISLKAVCLYGSKYRSSWWLILMCSLWSGLEIFPTWF